jgi:hypothetical protein
MCIMFIAAKRSYARYTKLLASTNKKNKFEKSNLLNNWSFNSVKLWGK